MRLVSTRGHGPVDLATALIQGPAPDGGLYLPREIQRLSGEPSGPSLADTAVWMFRGLFPDQDPTILEAVTREALDMPVPLVGAGDDTWVLELVHGPTGAFKDVGARFLAAALERLVPPAGGGRTVLVATSGDTGGAVARAFHGRRGMRVVVLFPRGRVSAVQRRQFTTLGANVRAVAVEGPFDACQRLAREAFGDPGLREEHGLTSANSLNVGRLLPQAAYYLHAAREAPWATVAPEGAEGPRAVAVSQPNHPASGSEAPVWVVPSGNLGNLTAGLLAARMGLPSRGFVAALNANDALARYLEGEDVSPDRPTVRTLSTAMDVGRPSNLERLRSLSGDDPRALSREVEAISVDDDATREAMARLALDRGYLADPHTGVAFAALARARADGRIQGPAVVLATAHPAKFPETVERATGRRAPVPAALRDDPDRPEEIVTIPDDLDALRRVLDRGRGADGAP